MAPLPAGRQANEAPGCPADAGGPNGVPILFAADTALVHPIHTVPEFVDNAEIVQVVTLAGGAGHIGITYEEHSGTGTPDVVTVRCP